MNENAKSLFNERRDRLLGIFAQAESEFGGGLDDAGQERFDEARQRLKDGNFYVVVCGEYKRGKSSLLNALLRRRGLLPEAPDIATNVVCLIRYGDDDRVVVRYNKGGGLRKTEEEISLDQLESYVTEHGNPKNKRRVEVVDIQLDDDNLRSGLVLVDTPGIGGIRIEHSEATYRFLPQADAAIFVIDAEQGATENELRFLIDASQHSHHMLTVVTKIDAVMSYDALVETTRERVSAALELDPSDVIVIPVSSKRLLEGFEQDDPELIADSNFDELEEQLWGSLAASSGWFLLLGSGQILDHTLEIFLQPLEVELSAIDTTSAESKQLLQEELRALRERSDALQSESATWRNKLSTRLREIESDARFACTQEMNDCGERFRNTYLYDDLLLDDPDEILNQIARDITGALLTVGDQVGEAIDDLATELAQEASLNLQSPKWSVASFTAETTPVRSINPRPTPRRRTRKLLRKYRAAGISGAAGGGLGSLGLGAIGMVFGGPPGAVLGAALGSAIGSVVGSVSGYRDHAESAQKQSINERRQHLVRELQPLFTKNKDLAIRELDLEFRSTRSSMEEDLLRLIESERAAVTRAEEASKRGFDTDEAARRQQADSIRARIERLIKIRRDATEVVTDADPLDLDDIDAL